MFEGFTRRVQAQRLYIVQVRLDQPSSYGNILIGTFSRCSGREHTLHAILQKAKFQIPPDR